MFKKNQVNKIEKIKKYYEKLNEDPAKVKVHVSNKILDTLSKYDRTRKQLEDSIYKNIKKDLHEIIVSSVLDDFEEKGYINEERFVENFIRNKCNSGFGEGKIKQELKQKGVDLKDYLMIIEEYDFFEILKDYLSRKHELNSLSRKEMESLKRKLVSRGFSINQISENINDYLKVDDGISTENKDETIKKIEKLIRKGYGLNKIKQDLKHQGFSFDDDIFNEFDFYEILSDYIEKKYGSLSSDYKEKQKQVNHLLSRGFSYTEIKEIE